MDPEEKRRRHREYQRRYLATHPEQLEKNRASAREYGRTHREERSAYYKQWRKRNPEMVREKQRKNYLRHKDRIRARNEEWKQKNLARYQWARRRWMTKVKLDVLSHYPHRESGNGGVGCQWCGFSDLRALSLDHVNDDSHLHGRVRSANFVQPNGKQSGFYFYLRRAGFPNDPPLQVLCMNCQFVKRAMRWNEQAIAKWGPSPIPS